MRHKIRNEASGFARYFENWAGKGKIGVKGYRPHVRSIRAHKIRPTVLQDCNKEVDLPAASI
jgi:hypothetical protein